MDVLLGQTVNTQHVKSVEVNAGAGDTDGDVLAFQIGNGLDIRIHGDDLNLLHVQRSDNREAVHCAGLSKQVGAGVGIAHNVRLAEAQLNCAGIQILYIGLRAVAHNRGHIQIGFGRNILCQHTAVSIVGAGVAAGSKGQLFTA